MKGYKYFTLNALLLLNVFIFYNADSFAQENQTNISFKADKALPKLEPEYEKVKSRESYVPGIKVIRGETQ